MGFIDEIRGSYRSGSLLIKLIYINVAVFVVIRLLQAFYSMSNGIASQESYPLLQWISVPSDPLTLLQRPWTLFTYMFVHYDFLHVLFNLLCLYWFGKVFMIFFTGRQLFTVYVVGGIAGAVAFLIGFNYIPVLYRLAPSSMLLGASASALAVLFAAARYSPDFRLTLMFIGEVRLKYIALVYFVIDLISIPALANTGGHLAHLGGALAGLLAGYYWSKYGFRRTRGAKSQSSNGGGFFDGVFRKKAKMKVAHRRPLTDMEYNAIKNNRQREVDRILEKVKASGYDSLTREEKKTLFDASQEL
jgi:membrane associated rhomboid family serine protease